MENCVEFSISEILFLVNAVKFDFLLCDEETNVNIRIINFLKLELSEQV